MSPPPPLDVVIIGAGAASLTAARTLLARKDNPDTLTCTDTGTCNNTSSSGSIQLPPVGTVTILEANSYIGGRIKSDDSFLPGVGMMHPEASDPHICQIILPFS